MARVATACRPRQNRAMADIFLSYAHEDQPIARQLAQRLAKGGWSVWWDRELPSGANFREEIQRQLDEARCVVVLWSNAAVASHFVTDEAEEGIKNNRLVPVMLERLVLPLGFRQLQQIDLADA